MLIRKKGEIRKVLYKERLHMRRIKNINREIIWVCFFIDIIILWTAYLASVWIRFSLLHGIDSADMSGKYMAVLFLVYAILVSGVLLILKVHSSINFEKKNRITTISIVNTTGIVALMLFYYLIHEDDVSRLAIFFFWSISTLSLVAFFVLQKRVIIRNWDKIAIKKQVIIVGNGDIARKYIQGVEQQALPLLYVEGYVGHKKNNLGNHLGNYEDLEKVLEEQNPDEVIIALEPHETEFMKRVMAVVEKEGIEIKLIPLFNEYIPPHPIVDTIGEVNLVNLRSTPLSNEWNAFIKRFIDFWGSIVLILLFSPIMLFIVLGVKISSPGPVFFCQERVGLGKRIFTMYKFRSMRVNDEQESGWTTNGDPRRTPFGTFLRKYSLDELPQLFNVVKGDMSLVGPRPEIPFYVRQFKEKVPLYLVRQQVRPGMTGWAQVHGLRGDTSIEDRVKYDIWYIENWSLLLDFRILLRTLFGGFMNNED